MSEQVECAIYVDMGTTNTRVWLAREGEVLARAQARAGVADTARDGSPARVHAALRDLIAQVRGQSACVPGCVVAAGMITSPLGLAEVRHLAAPAGVNELAAAVERHFFPDVTDLPILLVPGVRSGPAACDRETIGARDVMRGEETMCVGMVALGLIDPPATVLNLGSHWKSIKLDREGRISESLTSLAGELIYAAQTQTILASAVPHDKPTVVDARWAEAGMREQRRAGLARALFGVRLLEQSVASQPDERLSYLIGAFVASDLDALIARRVLTPDRPVAITGAGALADFWLQALAATSIPTRIMTETEVERGLLAGLRAISQLKPILAGSEPGG